MLGVQFIEQFLRFLHVTRIKPLSEPTVHRSQQFAGLLLLALVAPEACEAHGGAEFPGLCLLLTSDCECAVKIPFSFRRIGLRRFERDFPGNAMEIGFRPNFPW